MALNSANSDDRGSEDRLAGDAEESLKRLETKDWLSVTHDNTTNYYHATVDENIEVPLTVMIVRAVATITQTDPYKLEPLVRTLDPDSLQTLFESLNSSHSSGSVQPTFTFQYGTCEVTVESLTEITATPLE